MDALKRFPSVRRVTALFFLLLSPFQASAYRPNYNQPLDRPFTLRNPRLLVLERETARQIREGRRMSFIFPRPCESEGDSSRVCGDREGWVFLDSLRSKRFSLSPLMGYEYRYHHENVNAFDGGLVLAGGSGPASFHLDARLITEVHDDFNHPSYDREFVERQDEGASGSIAYSSYSRYRANLSYDMPWGRLTAGRDAAHWGPGLYHNQVFHQDAVPFNQMTFTAFMGPLKVQSLYGQLTLDQSRRFSDTTRESRSMYAHRYEWAVGADWLLGISEQMVLTGYEEPFAFTPIIPLFIFKGDAYERFNNGSIAADLTYRFARWGRAYAEFLIDDIQSPSSLFDDQAGNKWGAMAGIQTTGSLRSWEIGGVLEYGRTEPWVYTHYLSNTAQASNQGFPLGDPNGPGRKTATASVSIASPDKRNVFQLRLDIVERGLGEGASLTDTYPLGRQTKAGFWDHTDIAPGIAAGSSHEFSFWGCGTGMRWDGSGSGNTRLHAGIWARFPPSPAYLSQ